MYTPRASRRVYIFPSRKVARSLCSQPPPLLRVSTMRASQVRSMEIPEGNDRYTQKRREAVIEAKKRLALPAKSAAEKEAREKMLWGD